MLNCRYCVEVQSEGNTYTDQCFYVGDGDPGPRGEYREEVRMKKIAAINIANERAKEIVSFVTNTPIKK